MKKIFIAFFLSLMNATCFADNSLTISPLPFSIQPVSILSGHSATAYYLVTNTSGKVLKGNYIHYLPSNVTQITSDPIFLNTCGITFTLNPGSMGVNSCILQLSIAGEVNRNDPDPTHHLSICNQENCSGVDNNTDELNVVVGEKNNLASVAVVNVSGPSPLAYTTTDGGMGWTKHIIATTGLIGGLTCKGNNNQHCVGIGHVLYNASLKEDLISYVSEDGGINWTSHEILTKTDFGLAGIACDSSGQNCVAVGSTIKQKNSDVPFVFKSNDGGYTWSSNYPTSENSNGSTGLRAISCDNTAQYCAAVGDSYGGYENHNNYTVFIAYTSTDAGKTWTPHTLDKFIGPSLLKSITCSGSNGANCIAVGYLANKDINSAPQPIIYTTTDNWNTWNYQIPSIQSTPKNGGVLNSVVCSSANNQNCTAVGYSFLTDQRPSDPLLSYTTTDGGTTWTFVNLRGTSMLQAMTCSDTQNEYCTAIGYLSNDGNILPTVYGGFNKNNKLLLNGFRTTDENNLTNENSPAQNILPVGLAISSTG